MKIRWFLFPVLIFLTYIDLFPGKSWVFSMLQSLFPFVVLFLIFLIIYGIFRKKYAQIIPYLLLLILNLYSGRNLVAFHINNDNIPAGNKLKILNYNVSSFGLNHNPETPPDSSALRNARNLMNWIINSNADVICLQEYFGYENFVKENLEDVLTGKLGYYKSFSFFRINNKVEPFGLATFSRYPIIKSKSVYVYPNNYNRTLITDINYGSDTLRILNIHLQSTDLRSYFIKGNSVEEWLISIFIILDRLQDTHHSRISQMENVLPYIIESPYRVLVAGDFNSHPMSYIYKKFRHYLNNAFEHGSFGFDFTFKNNYLFFLRIDNQFYDRKIKLLRFRTFNRVRFSDHYPLTGLYLISDNYNP